MSLVNSYSQSLPQQSSSTSNTSATTKSSVQTNTTSTTTGNPFLDGIRLPEESAIPESKDQMLKQEDFFALLTLGTKLNFIYLGLFLIGMGSIFFKVFAPSVIKKYAIKATCPY